MTPETRRAELYEDVEQHVIKVLRKEGLSPEIAGQAANEVADMLASNWGGQVISFPRDVARSRGKRHADILQKFNGRNYGELATEFGYTERGIRRLIERTASKRGVAK